MLLDRNNVSREQLGVLGLIAATIHELGIVDKIDRRLLSKNKQKRRKIMNELWHFGNKTFDCSKDIESVIRTFSKSLKYHDIEYAIIPIHKHTRVGQQKKE